MRFRSARMTNLITRSTRSSFNLDMDAVESQSGAPQGSAESDLGDHAHIEVKCALVARLTSKRDAS
jgi:hypothetical protein